MSRHKSRREPAGCPCGSGSPYPECCGPLHRGAAPAGTAEQLMRSRFSAFAKRDAAYLLRSWHPDTRPARIDFDSGLGWERLEIIATEAGGPFHTEGTVEFRAHYRDHGEPGDLHERSRFRRDADGAWVYLDGQVD